MSLVVKRITPAEARKLGIPEVVTVISPVPKRKNVKNIERLKPGPTTEKEAPQKKSHADGHD